MPEGDSIHRAALELQVLVGQRLAVEAVGKTLLLRFEGGLVLRSHLRMSGRWRVEPLGASRTGRPWLVLRGAEHEAVLWNGPVLELARSTGTGRLGPDILAERPDYESMLGRLRSAPQERGLGDALLDQHLVAGIGNIWKAESLWEVRVSPWRPLADVRDVELLAVLEAAHRLMRAAVEGTRPRRHVHRRAGRTCHRCGKAIRSHPQGEHARIAYWCPGCQTGTRDPAYRNRPGAPSEPSPA